ILVRRKVTLTITGAMPSVGEFVRLRVGVEPECKRFFPSEVLKLRQRRKGEFVRVAATKPNANCVAAFRIRVARDAVFQGFAPAGTPGGLGIYYLAGSSTPERIEVE
ncbi:MAG: hypothetical protein ACRDHM_09235, partial [Actinomycetota bacterium]